MKKHPPAVTGRIVSHDHGAGQPSAPEVEARARELALIDGRSAPNVEDRVQARREIRGDTLPPTIDEDLDSSQGRTRDPSEPPSDFGSEKPTQEPDDSQNSAERMVNEGVAEAQHEQMIAARRRARS